MPHKEFCQNFGLTLVFIAVALAIWLITLGCFDFELGSVSFLCMPYSVAEAPAGPPPPCGSTPYLQSIELAGPFCSQDDHNVVLDRGDHFNIAYGNKTRPWSLHSGSYPARSPKPICKTIEDLLQSLRLGQRLPYPNPENTNASYFEPYGCLYRWFSPQELCTVFSRYHSFVMVGDSLSRHSMQGLLMVLAGDLVLGAQPKGGAESVYDNCHCDGQFSEYVGCRWEPRISAHSYGLCSTFKNFKLLYWPEEPKYVRNKTAGFFTTAFCAPDEPPDPRPRLLLIQTGAHIDVDSKVAMPYSVRPVMQLLEATRAACEQKFPVKVVSSGMNSQADRLNSKFPRQSVGNASVFNDAVFQAVRAAYNMDSLDFLNLTRNASVSDGYHYLTDVNVLKAMYFANLLDLWKPEVQ